MERKRTLRERTSKFIKDLVSDWRPSRDQVLWTIRVVIMLTVLLTILTLIGAPFGITLWAWVELLIVPVVLAIGGYLFSRSENRATQAAAERRAQDEALQAYLDKMSDMLIPTEGQPSLIKARSGEGMREVARARTLTVLPRLDSTRKARVVQFLNEADLIAKGRPFLDLSGANLTYADLSGADLSGAGLTDADLSYANLALAEGITQKQLEQAEPWGWEEYRLEGATMPDGQTLKSLVNPDGPTFEEWLKSKGSGENE